MKKLLVALVLFCCALSYAQNLENETKIIEVIGQEKYDQHLQSGSKYLKYLDVRISDGYELLDIPAEKLLELEVINYLEYKIDCDKYKDGSCKDKTAGIASISTTEIIEQIQNGDFNIIKYTIRYDQTKPTYYRLGATEKVLLVRPAQEISKIVNQ